MLRMRQHDGLQFCRSAYEHAHGPEADPSMLECRADDQGLLRNRPLDLFPRHVAPPASKAVENATTIAARRVSAALASRPRRRRRRRPRRVCPRRRRRRRRRRRPEGTRASSAKSGAGKRTVQYFNAHGSPKAHLNNEALIYGAVKEGLIYSTSKRFDVEAFAFGEHSSLMCASCFNHVHCVESVAFANRKHACCTRCRRPRCLDCIHKLNTNQELTCPRPGVQCNFCASTSAA